MAINVRLARPVSDLSRVKVMYLSGLDLIEIGHFVNHEGFDGVIMGIQGERFHFEFTYCRTHPIIPRPTPEDLLVFYLPNKSKWTARCNAMLEAGFTEVTSLNPYWSQNGRTFQDPDSYRVAIQCASFDFV